MITDVGELYKGLSTLFQPLKDLTLIVVYSYGIKPITRLISGIQRKEDSGDRTNDPNLVIIESMLHYFSVVLRRFTSI